VLELTIYNSTNDDANDDANDYVGVNDDASDG